MALGGAGTGKKGAGNEAGQKWTWSVSHWRTLSLANSATAPLPTFREFPQDVRQAKTLIPVFKTPGASFEVVFF